MIASNTTSLPELVGDAGILLDPRDVAGFAEAMRRVAEDQALAADLQAKALARPAASPGNTQPASSSRPVRKP